MHLLNSKPRLLKWPKGRKQNRQGADASTQPAKPAKPKQSKGQRSGRRPAGQLRPAPGTLARLTRDYATRIPDCEAERLRLEIELNNATKRRNDPNRQAENPNWQRDQAAFQKNLNTANLHRTWAEYARLHPGADHTHENAFLAWAYTTGAYPHGLAALEQVWKAATSQRPPDAPRHRTPQHTTSQQPPDAARQRAPQNARNLTLASIIGAAAIIAVAAVIFAG